MKRRTQGLHAVFLSFIFHTFISSTAWTQDFLGAGTVIISHLSPDYGLAADEFVILYNATADTVDLNGHEVRYFTASGSVGSAGRTFTTPRLLPPGKHLLLSNNDTVVVGGAMVLSDGPFTSGMATSGGQLVLRSSSQPDSIVFAAAWGTVTSYVAGMSDAAVWESDGMLALVWEDSAYVRSSHLFSNTQYVHVVSDSIVSLPSLAGAVSVASDAAWSIPVSIVQGSHGDSSLILGLDADATDGFDTSFDVPRPPPPAGTSIVAGIYRPDLGLATGDHLLRDVRGMRALADTAARWFVDVDPAESGVLMSLTLDVSSLPGGLPVQVRELVSGQRWIRQGDSLRCEITPASTDRIRFLVSVGDSTPPVVGFIHPSVDTVFVVGKTVEISLTIGENSGVDSVSLMFVVPAGSSSVAVLDTTVPVLSVSWTLPRRLLADEAGFRVFVRDSIGNSAEYLSPLFAIVPDTQRVHLTSGWHMFALPLEKSSQAALFTLEDSAFAFSYAPGRGYAQADALEPGRGYFLGLMSERQFTLPGIPVADSFAVTVQPGFAMISAPGPTAISLDDLAFLSQGTVYSYAGAVSGGLIASGLFGYDNSTGVYEAADSLQPWKGYWMPVLAPDVGVQFPEGAGQGSLRVIRHASSGWEVLLHAESDGIVDSLFAFGVHPEASDRFDSRFDVASPPSPPMGLQVHVFAERGEWGSVVGPRFLRDIRRDGALHAWTFTVAVRGGRRVTLRRGGERGTVPEGLMIQDLTAGGGEWEPFTEGWTYAWTGGGTRHFEVRSTTTSVHAPATDVPAEFTVSPNYPNPFNGITAVSLGTPERGYVRVAIYDLLGRLVSEIEEREYHPGHHTLFWTTELASGTYIGEAAFRPTEGGEPAVVKRWRMVMLK